MHKIGNDVLYHSKTILDVLWAIRRDFRSFSFFDAFSKTNTMGSMNS